MPAVAPAPTAAAFTAAAPARELDPLTAPLELLVGTPPAGDVASAPAWPCATCSTPNALDVSVCAGCGAGFLSVVARDEAPLLALPLIGDVTQWGKLQWLGAGIVLLLATLVTIMIVGALLG